MIRPAELRRARAAARTVHRYGETVQRLEERHARALAALAAILADADTVAVPGYRVTRTADGIAAEPQAPTHVDQLALWSSAA